jgi:monofunctional biosynthetic peptidoglycan transglycosylase
VSSDESQRGAKKRRWGRWLALRLLLLFLVVTGLPVLAYRIIDPPFTPLMLIRKSVDGEPIRKTWMPIQRISPALVRAVVASEDERFCFHHGFDWVEMGNAWREFLRGRKLRGASTISMQTVKNAFLWPGRNPLRKGLEAYFTALAEVVWPKARMLEIYLNVIEWGHGLYGAEAASRSYFGKSAAALNEREAALLAAVLPNPRVLLVAPATPYVLERAATIRSRMPNVTVPGTRGCA